MTALVDISVSIRKKLRRRPPKDMWPLIWFFVAVYIFVTLLTLFFGFVVGTVLMMSTAIGVGLLVHWHITPALPRTLPGHLIRLVMSSAWAYYALRRYLRRPQVSD